MKKIKLNVEEQIRHMKEKNGIAFNRITEIEAIDFLKKNNYFFKIKAYAKNYDKKKNGKYINLEFAYLQELSKIDMYFRKYIMKITLDIEHFSKVKLLNDIANNENEDGYEIVNEFLSNYDYIKDSIHKKENSNSVSKDLVSKYIDDFAVWNIIEVLSFGDFLKLYQLYYEKYNIKEDTVSYLWSVKFLRNAAAHNNCLINSLKTPYSLFRRNKKINNYVSKIPTIQADERKKKMNNPIVHDFVVTLFVFDNIVCNGTLKKEVIIELKDLIDNRFIKHKEYFEKNNIIKSHYYFIKKIVDYFYEKCI